MRRKEREIITGPEIFEILKKAEICRIALTDGDQPYIVALNFGIIKDVGLKFYFHCASEGRKLDIIGKNNKACIQVEVDTLLIKAPNPCGYTMNYQSVIGFGTIEIVSDPEEKIKGMDAIMIHYSGEKDFNYEEKIFGRTTLLRMDVDEITGKRKLG